MAIVETQINQGMLDAALEIGARRADTLRQVRQLLVDGEDRKAVELMKKFLNVNAEKNSRPRLVKFPRPAPVRGVKP